MKRSLCIGLACYLVVNTVIAANIENGLVALPDPSGINPPDYVLYNGTTKNRFDVFSGQTGLNLRSIDFFSNSWDPIAMAAYADGNSDGTADDAALAVLGQNISTGQLKVQLRDAFSGSVLQPNIGFFNSDWQPLGLAILEDSNGNGVFDDPAAAVLAQNTGSGRIMAELIRISDGAELGRWAFFNPAWDAKAVAAFAPEGGNPMLAVLATDPGTGKSKVQLRDIVTDTKSSVFVSGPAIQVEDLGILMDLNGDGTKDDPGLVVLGRKGSGNNVVRVRRVSDGSRVDDVLMVGSAYGATGLAMLADVNSSNYEDIAVLAEPMTSGSLLVKLRDLGTGDTIENLFLDKDVTPDTFVGRTDNIYIGDTYDNFELSIDASGREIIRTLLVVLFTPDATNTEVEDFLSEHNAIITASIAGSRSMTIRIPDPGTVEALAAIKATMQAESFVEAVYSDKPVRPKDLPSNVMEGSSIDYDFIKHQLAIDGHAAWNAKEAIQSEPSVLLPDFYGAGDAQLTSFMDINLLSGTANSTGANHGYHVAGILAGDYGGAGTNPGLITGVIPETINLDVLDLQTGISSANLDAWMLTTASSKSGTVILSTSLGDDCTCADNNTWGSECQNPANMATQAVTWINQVRGAGLENKLLHAVAASNRDDGSTWTPACSDTATTYGYRDANTSSAWNAATLMTNLMDSMANPVAPLSNTLVVENLRISPNSSLDKVEIVCMDENSFVGGNISAVGTDVQSLTQAGTGSLSGTSMATPQVASLAAYLLAIDPSLSPQKIIEILQNTGETPGTTGHADCSDWGTPATAINAYAAVLALDDDSALTGSPSDAPVRLAILDAADGSGNEGRNGQFDEHDLQYFIDEIEQGTQDIEENLDLTVRYSRTDLNADGYDGGTDEVYKKKFNLDIDYPPTYATVTQMIGSTEVEFDESSLSDTEILCYYAYSSLYTGSQSERQTLMDGRCRGGTMAVYVSYYREQSAGQDVGGFGCEAMDDEYDEARETFSTKSIPESNPFTFVPRALDQYWRPGDTDTEINLRAVNGATNYTVEDGGGFSCVSIPFTSETEFDSTLEHDPDRSRLNVDIGGRSRAECQFDPDGELRCSDARTTSSWLAEFDFEVNAPLSLTLVMQLNCSAESNRVAPDPNTPNPVEIGDMDFTYSTRRYNAAGEWIGSLPTDSFACPEDGVVDINQVINLDAPDEPNTTDNVIVRISATQNTLAPAPILLGEPTEPGLVDVENHMEGYVEVVPAP